MCGCGRGETEVLEGRLASLLEAWLFTAVEWSEEDKPALTPLGALTCWDRRETQTYILKGRKRETEDIGLHILNIVQRFSVS